MMRAGKWACLSGAALLAALCLVHPGQRATAGDSPGVQVGLVGSLFRDTPPALAEVLAQPIKTLMQSQTGLTGQVQVASNTFDLSRRLKDGKVQLGVFHGFEFAWARRKNPGL